MNLQYFPMDRQLCHIEIESCKQCVVFIIFLSSNDRNYWTLTSPPQTYLPHISPPPPKKKKRGREWNVWCYSIDTFRPTCRSCEKIIHLRRVLNVFSRWFSVGYTMRDIRYKWNKGPNSVGVSNEVSLPQFKVLGHRQRAMEISLTTGMIIRRFYRWPSTNLRSVKTIKA